MAYIPLNRPEDSQLLLTGEECEQCIATGTLWPTMRLLLLIHTFEILKIPMPSPSELASESSCYECFGPNDYSIRLMELAMLRRILSVLDPGGDTTPQALLDEVACFNCYGSTTIENMIELALVNRIREATR